MYSLNKLTYDDIPIPITHLWKPDRLGEDLTGKEWHEFGLALFMTFIEVQNGKLKAVNMNPENGAPNVLVENPEKVLLYVWVKTDLAPNIPVYVQIALQLMNLIWNPVSIQRPVFIRGLSRFILEHAAEMLGLFKP